MNFYFVWYKKMGNSISDSVKEGISVFNGPNGAFSVVRDGVNGTVSVFKEGINGLQKIYTDTEQNFFRTANNVQQNISNIAFDAEKNIARSYRATEKDIITALDDQGDQLQFFFRDLSHKWFDTLQWILSLGFLFGLLVLIMYGDKIFSMIDHVIQNGIKVSF
jgi:hypothetical protein